MASYNLTNKQKYLLTTIIKNIYEGQLDEPIITSCTYSGCEIIGIDEKFGLDLPGDLDALCDLDLMGFQYNIKGNKVYFVKQAGYNAITNNFGLHEKPMSTQLINGAIVHETKGGTLQASGSANESEIKQIANDQQLLPDEIKALTNQLLEVIKADLPAYKLVAYVKYIDELNKEIASNRPSPSVLLRLFNSLAFMGEIEGTISLTTRVWPYIYPILVIATKKVLAAG
jgi:hypothetical protein